MDEEDWEKEHKRLEAFTADFAKLVRKYMPVWPDPRSPEMEFLYRMQERTSCFNPYVWSEEMDPTNQGDKDVGTEDDAG